MRVGKSVRKAIDEFEAGDLESCVLHACNAVDGTARKESGGRPTGQRARFLGFLRSSLWLLEPMVCPGINLVGTCWTNVPLDGTAEPDFADIVYTVYRCTHGHGDEIPKGFEHLSECVATPGLTQVVLTDGR